MDLNNFSSKYKRILITGGAGFIGGALIRWFLNNSDALVFNLDKFGYASDLTGVQRILSELGETSVNRYMTLRVDLFDKDKTYEAIKQSDPDIIFHLAAESHVDRSIDNPNMFLESNVIGTYNLLQAARLHWETMKNSRKDNFRFQHISTDEVFGSLDDFGRFSEISKYDPRSPYSASKASSDHFVSAWHHTYGLPVLITNCSNNYGPWQFPEKLIPVVILKALEGSPIPLYGDGSNIRDWLFVEDHVEALILTALRATPGSRYCIGGKNEIKNSTLVQKVCDSLDQIHPASYPYSSLIHFVRDRPGHDYRYAIDPDLISNDLNWSPSHDFDAGLKKTIIWYLNNLKWCKQVSNRSGYSGERLGLN